MAKCPKCETELYEQKICPVCGNDKVPPNLPPGMNSQDSNSYGSSSSFGRTDWVDPTAPTEQDYADFIGPNASTYLRKFAKFKKNGVESYAFTWHWPVFFVGFWWFLYRKQYLWFLVALVLFFTGPTVFLSWLIMPMLANYLYFRDATNKIKQLKSTRATYSLADLTAIGRTNGWVPWVAILVTIGIVLIGVLAGSAMMYMFYNWYDWMPMHPRQLEF